VTARIRLAVPAISPLTETLLRVGVAAAVLEHLGEEADVELVEHGPQIHLAAQIDTRAADALVSALDAWLDGVLGPAVAPRRARIEVDVPVRPQLPQGNPQVGRSLRVTSVTSWG
jgi:hypothetical protein